MSNFIGYGNYCWIDTKDKKANCADKYKNIQTTCKPVNVFNTNDNIATSSKPYTDILSSGVRDTTIDYNYFRASRMDKNCVCPAGKCKCK